MAYVTPMRSTQPATSETRIELTMPFGPATAASCVSSVMCALASYPVNVYWATSSPRKNTYGADPQPVLFTNLVNTNDVDWWWSGRNASAATITTTPTMC